MISKGDQSGMEESGRLDVAAFDRAVRTHIVLLSDTFCVVNQILICNKTNV